MTRQRARRGGLVGLLLRSIGPVPRPGRVDPPATTPESGLVAPLVLSMSVGLLMIALGHHGGRQGAGWAAWLYWGGVLTVFLPTATRLSWPAVSRPERVALLLLLSFATFGLRLLYAPTAFADHDEFLHWVTAEDILRSHRLFLDNALLPVSPLYPGIEIVTTALANVAGLSVFAAAAIVVGMLRVTFVATLFCFYERVSRSPRLASLACLVYMGNSAFPSFDTQFSYESLAIVFLVLALLAETVALDRDGRDRWRRLALTLPFLASLAVTHHMSSYVAAVLLVGLAMLELLRAGPRADRWPFAIAAASAVALPMAWSWLMGNPSADYLGPVLDAGLRELAAVVERSSEERELFVAKDGSRTPLLLRLTAMAAVALVALGLATGFLRSLAMSVRDARRGRWRDIFALAAGRWRHSWVVLLTLLALAFPLSIALRLTSAGWEIGNRMGPFVFLGVALVAATAVVFFWQGSPPRRATSALVGLALSCVFLGGLVAGSGVNAVRSPYKVSADAASVEPMGREVAAWTRDWLGEGNRFAADRVNRLLLATYGAQDIETTLHGGSDFSGVFFSPRLDDAERAAITRGRIDYLLVDLRLTQGLPLFGFYFDQGEAAGEDYPEPPDPAALLKFNDIPRISRIFDNGWITILDVRSLRGRQ